MYALATGIAIGKFELEEQTPTGLGDLKKYVVKIKIEDLPEVFMSVGQVAKDKETLNDYFTFSELAKNFQYGVGYKSKDAILDLLLV